MKSECRGLFLLISYLVKAKAGLTEIQGWESNRCSVNSYTQGANQPRANCIISSSLLRDWLNLIYYDSFSETVTYSLSIWFFEILLLALKCQIFPVRQMYPLACVLNCSHLGFGAMARLKWLKGPFGLERCPSRQCLQFWFCSILWWKCN